VTFERGLYIDIASTLRNKTEVPVLTIVDRAGKFLGPRGGVGGGGQAQVASYGSSYFMNRYTIKRIRDRLDGLYNM
jgi:hypothetical protein